MNSRSSPKIKHLQSSSGLILAKEETAPYALKDKGLGAVVFCAHTGNSMHPTLSEHDLLEIEPYCSRPIRAGDVILFLSPDGGRPAVHRAASVIAEGVQTRGDNNNRVDPWFIRPEEVIGQVVWATQGEKRRPIYGGRVGQMWSLWVRGFTVVEKGLSFLYHQMARFGLLRRLVPLHKRMRIVALRRKDGRAFKLLLGNRVIGNYKPGMPYWQIRRPFRLFVDVESLPQ